MKTPRGDLIAVTMQISHKIKFSIAHPSFLKKGPPLPLFLKSSQPELAVIYLSACALSPQNTSLYFCLPWLLQVQIPRSCRTTQLSLVVPNRRTDGTHMHPSPPHSLTLSMENRSRDPRTPIPEQSSPRMAPQGGQGRTKQSQHHGSICTPPSPVTHLPAP